MPYLQVMKMRLWTPKDISVAGWVICISVGLFAFFTARNINRNPTFSAPVAPVIKTCWQLKVKFIVTRGPRVRCHIKNGLCTQSWPWKQTKGMRRDQRAAQCVAHHYSDTVLLGKVCFCECVPLKKCAVYMSLRTRKFKMLVRRVLRNKKKRKEKEKRIVCTFSINSET